MRSIPALLDHVNVASHDDGSRFVETSRLDAIDRLLREEGSPWTLQASGPLFRLYGRSGCPAPAAHPVLVSSHADSDYASHHHQPLVSGRELVGSFDNSITNAVVLGLLLADRLPHDAVVAFTGDEERESRGARDVVDHLRDTGRDPRAVIVLDVTDDRFYGNAFTVENWFAKGHAGLPVGENDFLAHLLAAFDDNVSTVHHDDAWQDESWTYEEHDVHVVSLCVPTAPADSSSSRSNWMHGADGVRVNAGYLPAYADALARLASHLSAAKG